MHIPGRSVPGIFTHYIVPARLDVFFDRRGNIAQPVPFTRRFYSGFNDPSVTSINLSDDGLTKPTATVRAASP